MKPVDVIEQLVGKNTYWEPFDNISVSVDDPEKFPKAGVTQIDFETGIVLVQWLGGTEEDPRGVLIREEKYSIKATLEPYEEP